MFLFCEKCGKKLVFKRPDGVFVFRFGKSHAEKPIVDIEILGDVKLKCLRRSCDHVTVLTSIATEVKSQPPKQEGDKLWQEQVQ